VLADNVLADRLSRWWDSGDWELTEWLFQDVRWRSLGGRSPSAAYFAFPGERQPTEAAALGRMQLGVAGRLTWGSPESTASKV